MARTIAHDEGSPRQGSLARAALVIVAVVLAIATAVSLGALYSLVWTGGQPLEGLVRDVQVTTAGIMTAEVALLWPVLKRAYGRSSEQMGTPKRERSRLR